MNTAKTNAERQRAFRQRKADEDQATEVRGIFAHPADHAEIKKAAARIISKRQKVSAQKKAALIAAAPLMRCANPTEFRQRLQWLSEGMLRNHLESIVSYTPCQNEIELYRRFKSDELGP